MLKNKIATIAVTAALGLSAGLVGCAGANEGTANTDATATTDVTESTDATEDTDSASSKKDDKKDKKKGLSDLFATTGYQGDLEDGKNLVYMEMSDTVIISLTDESHKEDEAEVYSGSATTDASGKTTVTDEETGKTISYTLTDNGDGTAEIDVDGHGKGSLTSYEGNMFSVIGNMATDDTADEETSSKK